MADHGQWFKDTDGVWRHPRYPKGGNRQAEGVDLLYEESTNGAMLLVDGVYVSLTFGELGFLLHQGYTANQAIQAENSRLWKEKEAIMIEEDGYVQPQYYRGRRIN